MTKFILDASITLAWFLDNPVPAYAIHIRDALVHGSRALVPALWHLEIANGFAVAERRHILTSADVSQGLKNVEEIVIQRLETEGKIISLRKAVATARAYQLSAYDAAYLDLASEQALPLATLDLSLRRAATRAGVELLL